MCKIHLRHFDLWQWPANCETKVANHTNLLNLRFTDNIYLYHGISVLNRVFILWKPLVYCLHLVWNGISTPELFGHDYITVVRSI